MTAEPWADLVSPRVGVIRALRPQVRGSAEPEPPHLWTATLANYDYLVARRSERVTAGKGRTEAAAKAAAVGEALERYCASLPQPMFSAVAADLENAITPTECVLYADEQYARDDWPYPPWDEREPLAWLRGSRVLGGVAVAVPAALVMLVAPTALVQMTTNGLAAGPDLPSAVRSGLCELIERDALMIAWMNRRPAVEIALETGIAAALHRHHAALGVELRAFVLPTDLPATVVLALALDDTPGRAATVLAMGCHPTPATALEKALFELCQARPAENARFRDRPPAGRLTRPEDVRLLDDHSAYAALPEQREQFAFLWRGGERASITDFEGHSDVLEDCAQALADLGYPPVYVELTTPDVRPSGYRIVRVLASGLQPIHFGFGQERLGGTRLGPELNPCPHPLA
ncbi:YcaO-like family protein [Solirubrobacter phytolaccae]|uniref:YcaO-like family protein n=1 Tax=Solirubrobacter phytolaccae TaxID=1404360 RepID=A0A9X3NHC9_9ACTN|nr:YcaO-like family protein [Solirubrobacter phytolaccae]MDA0183986.1 YcaO-like family protein [Solirubrobacter phytolaccae]